MKNIKVILISMIVLALSLYACKDSFLEVEQQGSLTTDKVATVPGVESLLIGTYAILDGVYNPNDPYASAASNWVYGSVASDDAYKGSDAGDQNVINPIERLEADPTNDYFNRKWRAVYEGVTRANSVLRILAMVETIDEDTKNRITAEARFLRGHYHFEAKKMWKNIPYIDESVDYIAGDNPGNTEETWGKIEADFQYAYETLAPSGMEIGRANKWAAASFLAKAYMFQGKFTEAMPLLETIIDEGVTQAGVPYALNDNYHDNFNAETNNSAEAVFTIQASVADGSLGRNSNFGDVLNFPHNNGPGGCCGFFQPTVDLANAYRTDANGLPMPDSYNEESVVNEATYRTDAYSPYAGNLDPRLDWTVGRRGIPYLDWGPHPGADPANGYIRDYGNGGPFSPKKNIYYQSQAGELTDVGNFWAAGLTAINYSLIRFADVLLWAAEAQAEVGSLEDATEYVNMVRERAANPESRVKTYVDPSDPSKGFTNVDAANYVINPYPTTFPDRETAREAIYFEKRLEFAMEGHRFFDLVRWGIANEVMDEFFVYESQFRNHLDGAQFTEGQDEYFPIPQRQIDLQGSGAESPLKQNPGYN